MIERFVYNLEFPHGVNEFKLGDYIFKKVDNYGEAFGELQHLSSTYDIDHITTVKTGGHQITGIVFVPEKEKPAVLPWGDNNPTQLLDVVLLLTLFNDWNVFIKDWEYDENVAILVDHRMHKWGGQLLLSAPFELRWKDRQTGEVKIESEIDNKPIINYDQMNVGFESSLNEVLNLISSEKWCEKYGQGYFLFLFKQAIQMQIIETSFILCWAIWEHIFTLLNKKWLSKKTIETINGNEKISFILSEYFGISLDYQAKKEISRLVETRNRIVHFGIKADHTDNKEMELFIRLTEQLMAIILELKPADVFDSTRKLKEFLSGKSLCPKK